MPSKEDNGMNSICEEHGRLRCDICALIDELKEDIEELREENERLKAQLDDAMNTFRFMNERPVPTTGKWFRDTAQQAIQRIKGEGME